MKKKFKYPFLLLFFSTYVIVMSSSFRFYNKQYQDAAFNIFNPNEYLLDDDLRKKRRAAYDFFKSVW